MDEPAPADDQGSKPAAVNLDERTAPAQPRDTFDRVVNAFYTLTMAASALYMLDLLTNGAIIRAAEPRARKAAAWCRHQARQLAIDQEAREGGRWVILEAQTIAHDDAHDRGIA